jgi:20S proteasome alpha/beta subunit
VCVRCVVCVHAQVKMRLCRLPWWAVLVGLCLLGHCTSNSNMLTDSPDVKINVEQHRGDRRGLKNLFKLPEFTKTGTTIVGVCCRDGVVIGADTRSTGGPLIVDKDKLKISRIAPRIYCAAAGTSADCDQIVKKTGTACILFATLFANNVVLTLCSNETSQTTSTKQFCRWYTYHRFITVCN